MNYCKRFGSRFTKPYGVNANLKSRFTTFLTSPRSVGTLALRFAPWSQRTQFPTLLLPARPHQQRTPATHWPKYGRNVEPLTSFFDHLQTRSFPACHSFIITPFLPGGYLTGGSIKEYDEYGCKRSCLSAALLDPTGSQNWPT